MISEKVFAQTALSFPDTDTAPHFEILSFRVNKKIFATYNAAQNRCTLKLTPEYQDIFKHIGKGKIYSVPNAWGKRYGWTTFELSGIKSEIIQDALLIAWRCTAPEKYKKLYTKWYEDET